MISRLGLQITRIFRALAPDPFVIAIILSLVTAVLALTIGDLPGDTLAARSSRLLDSWRAGDGLWQFLAFSMQMCLVLVTGHALAESPPVRRALAALASLPRTTAQAAALVGFMACGTAVLNWGLGLIVGAVLARNIGRAFAKRGHVLHYPLVVAAGYTGLMVWHGGLSGSAPLSMTTREGAAKVLPASALAQLGDSGIGLDQTTFSTMNLVITLGLLALTPLVLAALAPKRDQDCQGMERLAPGFIESAGPGTADTTQERLTFPDRLDRSAIVAWLLALPLLLGVWRFGISQGLRLIGLNEINAVMLAAGLILHGSCRSYLAVAEDGAKGCLGIILQFPLYAGIMAMMVSSGLVKIFAVKIAALGGAGALPFFTYISACIINLFVPSGGGQWGVQGPIALESGLAAGVPLGKMVMAVAYGDQLTNMLQPFWALPLLAVTGVKARDIVGYTAIVMLAAGVWIGVWLLVF